MHKSVQSAVVREIQGPPSLYKWAWLEPILDPPPRLATLHLHSSVNMSDNCKKKAHPGPKIMG